MLLLSLTTAKVLRAIVGLVPIGIGWLLATVGLGDLSDPTSLTLVGMGGLLVVVGVYRIVEPFVWLDLPN